MVAIRGHFDGKVIVPDEPLDLAPNQRLIVHIQRVNEANVDFRSWIGIATRLPQNPSPRFKSDEDIWGEMA